MEMGGKIKKSVIDPPIIRDGRVVGVEFLPSADIVHFKQPLHLFFGGSLDYEVIKNQQFQN